MRLARLYGEHVSGHKRDGFLLYPYLGCAARHQVNLGDVSVNVWLINAPVGIAHRDSKLGIPAACIPSFIHC